MRPLPREVTRLLACTKSPSLFAIHAIQAWVSCIYAGQRLEVGIALLRYGAIHAVRLWRCRYRVSHRVSRPRYGVSAGQVRISRLYRTGGRGSLISGQWRMHGSLLPCLRVFEMLRLEHQALD